MALAALLLALPAPAAWAGEEAGPQPEPPDDPGPTPSATPTPSPTGSPTPTPTPTPSRTPEDRTPDGDATPDGGTVTPDTEPSPTETAEPEEEEEEETVEVPPDPLAVTIERLSPSTVPRRGPVVVSGTVRNRSDTEWTDLSVYLLTSAEPLTTAEELGEAVVSDPRSEVGTRVVEPGTYVDLPALAPGESADYRLSVPRSRLGISGAPGVYWLGVHVLGTNDEGRLEGADGRARTFLPLVPDRTSPVELALGLQLRQRTARTQDGTLAAARGWERTLSEGRLRRLLDLGASAGTVPLTWVVDPAVADAALSTARGNPPLDLDPQPPPDVAADDGTAGGTDGEEPGGADGDTGEEGSDEGDDGNEGDDGDGEVPEPTEAELAASDWLDDLVDAVTGGASTVLALPYGDVDVSSVVRHGATDLVESAYSQGDLLLDELGFGTVRRALVPLDGLVSPAAADQADAEVPVVVAPDALSREAVGSVGDPGSPDDAVLERADGGEILVAPRPEEVLDGPAPGRRRTALAVRQRLLADAALEALAGGRDREPLVRLLPPVWDPGADWQRAEFFTGLDVPWLQPVGMGTLLGDASGPVVDPTEAVDYPAEQLRQEVPSATVDAAEGLLRAGALLDELLTENDQLLTASTRQALLAPTVWSRERPGLAVRRTRNAEERIDSWLDQITVRGPDFVTMSSESGTFQVTIVNGLDQPVTVGLLPSVAGAQLELSTPEPVQLGPQGRAAVQIDARATDIGVHQVVLQPVSESGTRVGSVTTIDVRSSNVGFILWIVMAVGGGLLFVAIVVRLVRRVARRRRTHGPLLKQGAS